MSATWIRYFDEGYNACYLYNEATGESLWEDDCNTEGMLIVDGASREIELSDTITSTIPSITNRGSRSDSESSTEEEGLIEKKKSKRFRAKDYARDAPPMSTTERNEYDLKCYSRFLLVNAVFIEAPVAVLEGVLRLALLFIACASKILFYCAFKQTYQHQIVPTLRHYFREILLTTAAIVSLAIPGCIYLVYREFSYENDWELRPIPTILGAVDMCRFATITYGGGALAANSGAQGYPVRSKKPKSAKESKNKGSKSDIESGASTAESTTRIGDGGQDAWSGTIMWVPRDVIADIRTFVSGTDNNIDSLSIAL